MTRIQVSVPVYLPGWLHQPLRRVKHAVFAPPAPPAKINIWGERQVEWTFISAHMPQGSGEALEFGCEFGYLSLLAARKGFHVTALDLQPQNFPWQDSRVEFLQGDLLQLDLPLNSFDLIINCSSVEHVGLAGRYGIEHMETDGDLAAMQRMLALLKPAGTLLMTCPCGRDTVFAPWHRVYGAVRLPKLLHGFVMEKECFWTKNDENRWVSADRAAALNFAPSMHPTRPQDSSYALACFVLGKSEEDAAVPRAS